MHLHIYCQRRLKQLFELCGKNSQSMLLFQCTRCWTKKQSIFPKKDAQKVATTNFFLKNYRILKNSKKNTNYLDCFARKFAAKIMHKAQSGSTGCRSYSPWHQFSRFAVLSVPTDDAYQTYLGPSLTVSCTSLFRQCTIGQPLGRKVDI